jgi:hypothetical protein
MCSVRTPSMLSAARAEALFTSDLTAGEQYAREQVTAAIQRAIRTHGGVRGCAATVAAAYGEHPETAVARMRWARSVVFAVYPADHQGDEG